MDGGLLGWHFPPPRLTLMPERDLSDAQQDVFDSSVRRLGLAGDDVPDSVVVETGDAGLDQDDGPNLPTWTLTLQDPGELRSLASDLAGGEPGAHDLATVPAAVGADPRRAALAFALGGGDDLAVTAAELFPLRVVVAAARDVTVRANTTWTLRGDGHNPLVVTFGTVTLEAGANVACEVPVHMTVQKFIKE